MTSPYARYFKASQNWDDVENKKFLNFLIAECFAGRGFSSTKT